MFESKFSSLPLYNYIVSSTSSLGNYMFLAFISVFNL